MMKVISRNLFVVFAITLIAVGCEKKKAEEIIRPVVAIQVGSKASFEGKRFPGQAKALNDVNLSFEVPGTLIERPAKKGEKVKEGQFLAKLNPEDFQNAVKASRAELIRAKAQRDRVKQAAAAGAVAQQELTNAEASVQVAEADLKIKQKSLSETEIHAPFTGEIAETFVDNFQNVRSKQPVLRLIDISSVEVTVQIPESGISLVPHVRNVRVNFDVFPGRTFPAKITKVVREASKITRTFPVTVQIAQPKDVKILPGMAAEVWGEVELPPEMKNQNTFRLPLSAVASDSSDKKYVWIFDKSSSVVKRRNVKVDNMGSLGLSVEGVKSGEWIVTAGVNQLREGQKVRMLQ